MKRIFQVLCLLLMANGVLTSCLESKETEVVLSDEAAITGFTLGTLNRYQYVASKTTGLKDSLVKSTFTGSVYKMTIDQIGNRIFNHDTLPYGTDLAHVLCTVTTTSSSGVALLNPADSLFYWHQSTDSVDFSTPRTMRVFATDGTYAHDYSVELICADDQTTTTGWELAADTTLLAQMQGMRVLSLNDRLVVFGQIDGYTHAVASADGQQWQLLGSNINTVFEADAWQDVVLKDSFAYMLNNTMLFRTTDGEQWEQVAAPNSELRHLVAAGTKELFALGTDGRLKASTDDGLTWTDELLDDDASLLPTQGLASTCFAYTPSDSTDYVLLVGNNGTESCVWHKISQYGGLYPGRGQWVRTVSTQNAYPLPVQQQLSLVSHNGLVLAAGSTIPTVYQTRDQGITWKPSGAYQLPAEAAGDRMAMTADGNGCLWVVTTAGQVWRLKN